MKGEVFFAVLSLLVIVGFAGCKALGISSQAGPANIGADLESAPFMHVVLFKLKADAPEGEREALVTDAEELLAKVPSVKEVRAGPRAPVDRPYNLKDFDVALLVKFADKAGLEEYIEHPLHKKYVEKHSQYWEEVKVADFVAK